MSRPARTLIINGSPNPNGNTAALVSALRETLKGEAVEVSAFRDGIAPCIDCRGCWATAECIVEDAMRLVYDDDYDNVVIASPVWFGTLPGAVLNLASRLQTRRSQHIANASATYRAKRGAVLLTAGGRCSLDMALHHARCLLRPLRAFGFDERTVVSGATDMLPAWDDERALAEARALGEELGKLGA